MTLTPEQLTEGLLTHCGMCGTPKGQPCRPVSKRGVLTGPMHLERVTWRMHKRRNG